MGISMSCNEFDHFLDDESGEAINEFVAHTKGCEACRIQWQSHQHYLSVMRTAQVPDMNSARAASMLRRVAAQGESAFKNTKQPFVQGFIAASVLAVALVLGVGSFDETSSETMALVASEYDWSQEVTIAINVPRDMDGAQLVLRLPADISIQGYEYLSQVQWPVDLKQGRNTIVLPVSVDDFAEFANEVILSASLIYENTQKDFELNVNVDVPENPSHGSKPLISSVNKVV